MEVRGGNGYIEEWVNPRLVRDAHIGVLWEGTSNINALDIITRAVGKSGAHRALAAELEKLLDEAAAIPAAFRDRLRATLQRALDFAERVAAEPALEANARRAASGLYHIASAVLMAWEASRPNVDARRALLARLVLEHRLGTHDPLEPSTADWEGRRGRVAVRRAQDFARGIDRAALISRCRAAPVRNRDRPCAVLRATTSASPRSCRWRRHARGWSRELAK